MAVAAALGNVDPATVDVGCLGLTTEREQRATRQEVGRDVIRELGEQLGEHRPGQGEHATTLVLHREAVPRKRVRRRAGNEALEGGDPVHAKTALGVREGRRGPMARDSTRQASASYRGGTLRTAFVQAPAAYGNFRCQGSWYKSGKSTLRRSFTRFIGVDLGGARGKTTALAELRSGPHGAEVIEVATRQVGRAGFDVKQPWTDETLVQRLAVAATDTVIAIDAPLTQSACNRCERPVCPGMESCADPAVVWLRTEGRALVRTVAAESVNGSTPRLAHSAQARLAPYTHRATEVVMTYGRGLLPVSSLGGANGGIAARAGQLRRRLRGSGFELHANLLEVSPAATVAALCDVRVSRGYKRDADPWRTRALILERLGDLSFAPQSRMAREDVLQNDHCFDAVIAAYTAYLWARDGWSTPPGCFDEDGWIVAPP